MYYSISVEGEVQYRNRRCAHVHLFILCISYRYTRSSVLVCIVTENVPPTSEEYLSVVSAEKPRTDSPLRLSHGAMSAGKGGSSL